MDNSENEDINRQLREVLEAMDAAKTKRRTNFEQALNSKDLNLARQLVAYEIAAEKRLEQVMHLFGDRADTWGHRAHYAGQDKNSPAVQSGFNRMQGFAEAELACRELLHQSETEMSRLRLLELEVSLASHSELQRLLEKWSKIAEKAQEAGHFKREKFALDCKSICQRALDKMLTK